MELIWALESLTWRGVVDILLVTLLFYGISFVFRGTQAVALVRGMVLLLTGVILLSNLFQFQALSWLLTYLFTVLAVAIPVIFQPELRRALERIGRGSILRSRHAPDHIRLAILEEVVIAAEKLAERRHGALIVLQRNTSLMEFVRTGVALNSEVSAPLLLTIFWPKTELHDGAAIIDDSGRIAAAAAVLPLTANRNLPSPKMGTRHRAALGISEVSDALCVVVSEETGKIAITQAGRMISRLEPDRLRTILKALYGPQESRSTAPWPRVRERALSLLARRGH